LNTTAQRSAVQRNGAERRMICRAHLVALKELAEEEAWENDEKKQ
jgi:hypothetical protein